MYLPGLWYSRLGQSAFSSLGSLNHFNMVPALSPQSPLNSCMGEKMPAIQLLLPAITLPVFEMGNELKRLQAPNSTLMKGSGSAEDRVSAADDFQPSGLPGKAAISGCCLPNTMSVFL